MKIYLTRASGDFGHIYNVGIYSSVSKAKDALRTFTDKSDDKWIVEQDLDPINIDDNKKLYVA